jgi:hypothetical protein
MSTHGYASEDHVSERAQQLLKTLVEHYIRDGQPVGSRILSRESGLQLSSATVRNVMAHLGRSRADGQGVPVLRQYAAQGPAAG